MQVESLGHDGSAFRRYSRDGVVFVFVSIYIKRRCFKSNGVCCPIKYPRGIDNAYHNRIQESMHV